MSQEIYDLPTSWVWATVSQVANVVTGNTPSKSDKSNYGSYLPWVKPPQLDSETPITDTPEKLSRKGVKLARVLPKDSILVSCIGLLGKIGLAGCDLATNQQINSLIFHDIIFPRYGYYYCKSRYFKDWLHSEASATTVSILNKGRFLEAPIPVPPLNEQKRIAKKIEGLLGRLTKTKQELAKILPILKKFRQSVLAKAFCGELTKEWREKQDDLEPASILLERIRDERKKLFGKKYKEPKPIDGSDLPELPEGWEWASLEMVTEIIMGQSPPSSTYNKNKQGLPFFQGKAEFGEIHPAPVKWCREPKKVAEAEDILISVRAPVGPTNLADQKCCIGRGLAAIRPLGTIPSKFILYYLRHIEEELSKKGQGSTFTAISNDDLRGLPFPLPPLQEQLFIINRIQGFFAQAFSIEKSIKIAQAHCEKLTQSILAKAFRGKLVEQDPNDEPAKNC